MKPNPKSLRSTPIGYNEGKFGAPEYTDWLDESMSWKETCYIGDWSFLNERRFKGPDALRLFSDISVNSFEKFDIGQAKHVIHCHKSGKVILEGILSRLDHDEFMLFGRGTFYAEWMLKKGRYNAASEPDDLYNLQVSGPTALAVIEKAARQELRDVRFMRFRPIEIAGRTVWALRQGMAGEVGFELQGPINEKSAVYDAILDAGREYGIRRLGARTYRINHLEACFPTVLTDYLPAIFEEDMAEFLEIFNGSFPPEQRNYNLKGSFEADDISAWYRSPVDLGWAKNVKFDHDFIGREALQQEVATPKRTIRTLVWNDEDVEDVYASFFRDGPTYQYMEMPRDRRGFVWQDQVLCGGQKVGISTSRGYSYFFREMLSLCVVDLPYSDIGREVVVRWGDPGTPQKLIRAHVAHAPYKPDNRRADLSRLPEYRI
jgi:vanillate/3-O-methylgallate O-demethylase